MVWLWLSIVLNVLLALALALTVYAARMWRGRTVYAWSEHRDMRRRMIEAEQRARGVGGNGGSPSIRRIER